jgi:cytochrome c oxidase subunit 4
MSQLESLASKGHAAQPETLEVHSDGRVHAHISSLRFYVGIFLALIFFTLLTVAVSNVHLGKLNLIVAVVIASMKASLVVLFFMHLRYDSKFNSMILIVSLLFIGIFFAYTMNDTERRGEIDLLQGVKYSPETGLAAPGGIPEAATGATGAAAPAGEAVKPAAEKK